MNKLEKTAQGHAYISTACYHGLHDRCRQSCKFCSTPCRCDCGHKAGNVEAPECRDADVVPKYYVGDELVSVGPIRDEYIVKLTDMTAALEAALGAARPHIANEQLRKAAQEVADWGSHVEYINPSIKRRIDTLRSVLVRQAQDGLVIGDEQLTDEKWKALCRDISDRRGLKWEWNKLDDDVLVEIRKAWSEILFAPRREPESTQEKPRICTNFTCPPIPIPPIPIRSFDWQAWIDGREEIGPYGSGKTEQEAIEDLKSQLED